MGELRDVAVELELGRLRGAKTLCDPDHTELPIEERVMVPMKRFLLVFADRSFEELYTLRSTMQLQHSSSAAYAMLLVYSTYALYGSSIPGRSMLVLEWGSVPNAAYNLYWLLVHACALVLLIIFPVFKSCETWRCCARWAFVQSERFAALYFGLVIWFQCLLGNRVRVAELLGHRPQDVFGTGDSGDDGLLLQTALILIYLSMYTHIRFKMLLFPGVSAVLAYPVSTFATPSGRESPVRQIMNSVMLALMVFFIFVGQRQIEVTRRRNLLHEIQCQSQHFRLCGEKEMAKRRDLKLMESKEVQYKLWKAVKKTRVLKAVREGSTSDLGDPAGAAAGLAASPETEREAERRAPSENLDAALPEGVVTDWAAVDRAVLRIRDPAYSLREYHEDMVAAFPELALYTFSPHADGGYGEGDGCEEELLSSGRSRLQEIARTFGALYAVYWFMRLDMDGRQGFCFGYDDDFTIRPVPEAPAPSEAPPKGHGAMSAAERQINFYHTFPWWECHRLVTCAGLMQAPGANDSGPPRVNPGRLKAMLALTAIHDVMKNEAICPTVQAHHAPFHNYRGGQVIHDHDVALHYVMTFYGHILPSYGGLDAGSQRLLRFTQGKMGFNNGWLVQGEAPPGALFHTFRQLIHHGEANSSDVAFYFMHWVTDLAGAEPTPLRGSEKFVQQFPRPVLVSFFRSFPYVWKLNVMTETQVFQEYLRTRWSEEATLGRLPVGEKSVALMRLALHVQGLEGDLEGCFDALCPRDRGTLVDELGRTGLPGQYYEGMNPRWGSPALLVYYGPAFLRQNSDSLCPALSILAEVYRQGRKLFPLVGEAPETRKAQLPGIGTEPAMRAAPPTGSPCIHTASIRIEQLKDLAATDITGQTSGLDSSKVFFLVSKSDIEAVVEQKPISAINTMVDEGVNFAYLNFAPLS